MKENNYRDTWKRNIIEEIIGGNDRENYRETDR